MKSALKALSLSLLVFVPALAHEGCSKTITQTTTVEDKHVQTTAATEETTEATRKPTPVTEVTVATAQEVAPKAEAAQTAEVTETIKN